MPPTATRPDEEQQDVEMSEAGASSLALAPKAVVAGDTPEEISVTFNFRFMAWLVTGIFAGMLVVCGAITFLVSDYTEESDAVFAYYGTFNPCIWLDHFPANAVGVVLFACMCWANLTWIFAVFQYLYLLDDMFLLTGGALVLSFRFLCETMMVNVFTADLYADAHGLVDGDKNLQPLTEGNTFWLKVHTMFYIVGLVGHLATMPFIYRVSRYVKGPRSWLEVALWVVGGAGLAFGIMSMLIYLAEWTPTSTANDRQDTWVQEVVYATRHVKVGLWHFVPAFAYPFALPKTHGVVMRFRRAARGAEDAVSPHGLVSVAFAMLGGGVLLSFMLQDPNPEANTRLILTSGFSEEPYNYFFVPLWLVVTLLTGYAVALSVVQLALNAGTSAWRTRAAAATGAGLLAAMALALWVVTPELATSGVQAVVFMVLLPVFVVLTSGLNWRTALYTAVWFGAAGASAVDQHTVRTVANCVIIALLMLYHYLAPDGEFPHLAMRPRMKTPVRGRSTDDKVAVA